MLASGEEDGTLDSVRFSLASEIVELVVLTSDEAFLQTLRGAVGDARRLWHVPSADKVSDLLVAGEVGILVLDVQALNETASVFVEQIKRQFPDLVVVVAGDRDAEISLARLISAGIVYRFIHKPMSPGRAKLFADAAVKKYGERRSRPAAVPPIRRRSRSNRSVLIGGTIGTLGVIAAATWVMHGSKDVDTGEPRPGIAHSTIDDAHLIGPEQAGELTLVKSVKPVYPAKASLKRIQGWVELDFTVTASGAVEDIAVHAASAPGVFEEAAISALSQWRYNAILRGAKSVAQRARIRIRFALAD